MDELTILSTTDVHGFFTDGNKEGGIRSLAAIAKNYEHPILIDNGDFLVGSSLATFFNTTRMISPLIDLANRLGFDVMVPGNHDFDYGIDFLKRQVASFNGKYLCANLLDEEDALIFDPYTVLQRGSIKVGVIGVVTSAMPQIADYRQIKSLKFLSVIETLKKWIPLVREVADLVIVSYHGGIERDMKTGVPTQYDTGEDQTYRIIQEISGIDGLICGHQHRINAGIMNETAFIQPGYRGNYVGCLTYDLQQKKQPKIKTVALFETKDVPLIQDEFYQKEDYQQWLAESLDVASLFTYLEEKIPNTFFSIRLQGETIGDFLASFTPPYTLFTYHLSKQEVKELLSKQTVRGLSLVNDEIFPPQEDYKITTNQAIWPIYRLEMNYIYNIFDEYLAFVTQGKEGMK